MTPLTTVETKPEAEYSRRLGACQQLLDKLSARDRQLSGARLICAGLGIVMGWAVFNPDRLALGWLLVPIALFVMLAVLHEIIKRRLVQAQSRFHWYAWGLRRLRDEWAGTGVEGQRFRDDKHPYACDLDLFGKGSLYELLCTARSSLGQRTLANWLLEPAATAEVRERQAAVAELAPDLDLREEIGLFGEKIASEVQEQRLAEWATGPETAIIRAHRIIAAVLPMVSIIAIVGWLLLDWGLWPLALALTAAGGFHLRLRETVHPVLVEVGKADWELNVLSGLLHVLETRRGRFSTTRLRHLAEGVDTCGKAPSNCFRHLGTLIDRLEWSRNQVFAPFALLLLWNTQLALAIEAWRSRYGEAVPTWLDSVGELEALAAFAGYAYEHPNDVFAEVSEDGPLFVSKALAHPLLPERSAVRNDVELGTPTRLLVVSGSNMSGKSTYLRAIGTAAVMALAGAPVRARRLRLSILQVGGAIRVMDSLREGISGFYAEIMRLRQMVELSDGTRALLFLLDEILHTTNSNDRRIGSRAILSTLLARGAIGLVTTHDLAITGIVDEVHAPGEARAAAPAIKSCADRNSISLGAQDADLARNAHFVDQLEAGEIRFDYRLRPGVVQKTNAIDLMRSIGLDV